MSRLGVIRRAPLAAVAWTALIGASGCVDIVATGPLRYVEREEKQFAVAGRPDVSVSTFDGSIEVRPWDRSEVLVVIEKYALSKEAAADIEVLSRQDGNRVSVEARVKPGDR